jgi:hypothetical protein
MLLCILSSATLMILAAATYAQQPAVTNTALPAVKLDAAFSVPPYLQDLRTNQVTVMWRGVAGGYGWVEYGETEALGKQADTVFDGLRETGVQRHAVCLSGLKPGTRYWYRTGMRSATKFTKNWISFTPDVFSPVYSFTTPSAQEAKVRCIILADTHNNATFGPLLSLPGVEPYDFSLFNGDCFGDITSEADALGLLRAYTELVKGASRPAVFVRGNHELRSWYAPFLRHLFTTPEGHSSFAFTRGPVRFVVLDCGEDKRDAHRSYGGLVDFSSMRVEVARWLDCEIASQEFRKARWHVLVVHIPLYGEACSEHARPLYLPVLDKTKFDLEINGHIHVSRLLKPGAAGNPHPVVSVGGFCTAIGVFEATAASWSFKVLDNTGKALVDVKGGTP